MKDVMKVIHRQDKCQVGQVMFGRYDMASKTDMTSDSKV